MEGRVLRCRRFAAWDFLAAPPPDGPFQFVCDRGCLHVFDEPRERQRFAVQVAAALAPGGLWLSAGLATAIWLVMVNQSESILK